MSLAALAATACQETKTPRIHESRRWRSSLVSGRTLHHRCCAGAKYHARNLVENACPGNPFLTFVEWLGGFPFGVRLPGHKTKAASSLRKPLLYGTAGVLLSATECQPSLTRCPKTPKPVEPGIFAAFAGTGGAASPTARSHLRRPTVASPEPPRSTSVWATEGLRGGSGEARGRVRCKVGGIAGQRLGGLGRQAGFGWVAETRETGKGPEPGHRLAREPSGKPSNPSIGKSDEPGFAL